jgi:hypothetical protein
MDTVGDLLELDHPDEATALEHGRRRYEYHRFRATAYKTANYLRYNGVGPHATVAILDDLAPEAVFGVLGTGLLGGTVDVAPAQSVDDAVLFGPTADLGDYEAAGGCKRVGYGTKPEDPTWAFFEREIWSENPFFPKSEIDGEVTLVDDWSQRAMLERAQEIATGLSPDEVVAVRGSLTDPATLVGGVLAPLVVGATILLPEDDQTGTVAVGDPDAPEERVLSVDDESAMHD